MKLLFYLIVLAFLTIPKSIQAQGALKDAAYYLELLTSGRYQQWHLVGHIATLGQKSCEAGTEVYLFHKEMETLRVDKCQGKLGWFSSDHSFSVKEDSNGDPYLLLDATDQSGGHKFYLKELSADAPACEEQTPCLRLRAYGARPDEETASYYLTY